MFAPAVVVSPEKSEPKKVRQARLPRKACPEAAIELQIDGATFGPRKILLHTWHWQRS
jgi:transposase